MHILKRSLLLLGVTSLALTACKDDEAVAPQPKVNSVTVTPDLVSVRVGLTVTLVATVDVDNDAGTTVTWSSSDQGKATVGPTTGVVTGVTPGVVVITATSDADPNKKGTATVNVNAGSVLSVEVLPPSITLFGGQTGQFAAVVNTEAGVANTVTWRISPTTGVATIDANGVVTASSNSTSAVKTAIVTAVSTADTTKRGAATLLVNPGVPQSGVISVSVSPPAASVRFPDTQVFVAQVQVNTGIGTGVNWTVSDGNKAEIIGATNGSSVTVKPKVGATGQVGVQATSAVDPGKSGAAVLNILPPLTPPSVSINSVNVGGTLLPVNPGAVVGQIDVIINADPGDFSISKLEILVDGFSVASQDVTINPDSPEQLAELQQVILSYNTGRYAILNQPSLTGGTVCRTSGTPAPHTTPAGHACVDFLNGQHLVSVRATTNSGSDPTATSIETNLTFANIPGFHVVTTPNANSATGSNGQVWFGGPAAPRTRVQAWPVRYDAVTAPVIGGAAGVGRTVTSVQLCVSSLAGVAIVPTGFPGVPQLATCATDATAPFDTSVVVAQSNAPGTPAGVGFVNAAASTLPTGDGLPVAIVNATAALGQALLNTQVAINIDNTAPTGQLFTIPAAPMNWVNENTNFTTFVTRGTDAGVGIAAASTDIYRFWDLPSLTKVVFTPNAHGIPEDLLDFTNSAYDAEVQIHDLLLNFNIAGSILFGVDTTAPTAEYMGNLTLAAANALVPNATNDSIMHNTVANTQGLTSASALFGARYRDTRSGFFVGSDTLVSGGGSIFRRIVRFGSAAFTANAERSATAANTCGAIGNHVRREGLVGADDPTYRRDSLTVVGLTGLLTAATPGIYTYTTCAKDRAGNESPTVTKKVLVDITAPQITGLQIPAILIGGTFPAFTPTGLDDQEVSQGGLYFTYRNLAALSAGAATRLYYPPFSPGAAWPTTHGLGTTGFNYEAPDARTGAFNAVLCTPVGPGAPCGDSPKLTSPLGFLLGIDVVAAGDSSPPAAVTATYKVDSVGAMIFDVKRLEATLGGTTPDSSVFGADPVLVVPILGGLVAAGTPFSAVGVGKFFIFGNGTSGSVAQARAKTSTSITNAPFNQVAFFRYDAATPATGRWVHIGTVGNTAPTNPTIFDQGLDRFWTYSLSGIVPALVTGETIIAVGMSAAGNGLSTRPVILP